MAFSNLDNFILNNHGHICCDYPFDHHCDDHHLLGNHYTDHCVDFYPTYSVRHITVYHYPRIGFNSNLLGHHPEALSFLPKMSLYLANYSHTGR